MAAPSVGQVIGWAEVAARREPVSSGAASGSPAARRFLEHSPVRTVAADHHSNPPPLTNDSHPDHCHHNAWQQHRVPGRSRQHVLLLCPEQTATTGTAAPEAKPDTLLTDRVLITALTRERPAQNIKCETNACTVRVQPEHALIMSLKVQYGS